MSIGEYQIKTMPFQKYGIEMFVAYLLGEDGKVVMYQCAFSAEGARNMIYRDLLAKNLYNRVMAGDNEDEVIA